MRPSYLVVMGVAGCGKSTIAALAAARLGWPFVEGDQLHSPANIDKMTRGVALTDEDRLPWLRSIAQRIADWRAAGTTGIVTCSSLRRQYRDIIRDGHDDVCFVYLHADRDLIVRRFSERRGHFMPASLIDSQFATLEEPGSDEPVLRLEIAEAPEALVDTIARAVARPD